MHDLAGEQIGDGRQSNMRMRAHIGAARKTGRKINRAHVIEEDERPDHAPLGEGQHAADLEAVAEFATPLFDDHLNHVVSPRQAPLRYGIAACRRQMKPSARILDQLAFATGVFSSCCSH